MIARISGEIAEKLENGIVIDLNGLGYEIIIPSNFLVGLQEGQKILLYIAENIKEDEYSLFGFPTREARQIYYKLTSVNGVGPKAAMSILSAQSSEDVQNAILTDDVNLFSNVSGIGKKTAQRIILDLKGKLIEVERVQSDESDHAYQALISLGYSAKDAQSVLKEIDPSLSTQERIKLALKGVKK